MDVRKDLFSLQPTNQIQLALYTPTDGSRENVFFTVHHSLFLPYCLWRDVPISLPLEPLAPFPLPSHLIIEHPPSDRRPIRTEEEREGKEGGDEAGARAPPHREMGPGLTLRAITSVASHRNIHA